ncbi:MAG TPA: deoxyribonuclease IV [Tenericutes bacterium]|nr:deoxyribonuclease IV [Mycoplasmatota bacterium]
MSLIIGSHVSFTKDEQLLGSVKEALSYGANAFMFYLGAPQNTYRADLNDDLTKKAKQLMKEKGIDFQNVLVHAPYIINLANEKNHDFSISFLKDEIRKCDELGIKQIILHPGSHVGLGEEKGIQNVIDALNKTITKDQKVLIALETMSGKGSECGKTFTEIKKIIDGVKLNEKLSVCMDTCHLHDSGYDISRFDEILLEFDKIIGLNRLSVIHVNDSKNERGEKKDRHANIGYGKIGFDNLIKVIYHPKLAHLSKILETPYVSETPDSKELVFPPYKYEIQMIKEKKFYDFISVIRKNK